ncbi:hypothetical protein ACUXK4_003377 [Methylorubrum extorquens]
MILDSQTMVFRLQAGLRGTNGKQKIRGFKRHVLTFSRGLVLAALARPSACSHTQAAGWLFDRAAQAGWSPRRLKVVGINTDARMDEGAARHGLVGQITPPAPETNGFEPLPLSRRSRFEATFGPLTTRYQRPLIRGEQSPATA